MTKKEFKNVKVSTKGDKLHITIDLKAYNDLALTEDDLSAKGSAYVIGTTYGIQALAGDKLEGLGLGLTLTAKRKPYDEKLAMARQREEAKEIRAEMTPAISPELAALASLDKDVLNTLIALANSLKK